MTRSELPKPKLKLSTVVESDLTSVSDGSTSSTRRSMLQAESGSGESSLGNSKDANGGSSGRGRNRLAVYAVLTFAVVVLTAATAWVVWMSNSDEGESVASGNGNRGRVVAGAAEQPMVIPPGGDQAPLRSLAVPELQITTSSMPDTGNSDTGDSDTGNSDTGNSGATTSSTAGEVAEAARSAVSVTADMTTTSESARTSASAGRQSTATTAGATTSSVARSITPRGSTSTTNSTTTTVRPTTTARPATTTTTVRPTTTARPATTTTTVRPTTTARPATTTTTTTTVRPTTTARPTTTTTTRPPTTGQGTSGQVVWEENFNSLDTSKWRLEHSSYGDGNNELQCYRPENVSVADGKLILRAVTETYTCPGGSTRQVTSGMIRSRGVTFSPGQAIEFRVKLNPADADDQGGLWPAVWASGWGDGGWPRAGEMDWLEVMTAENPNRAMFSMHYADPSGRHRHQNKGVIGSEYFSANWHTIRFDYGYNGELTWYLNGVEAFHVDSASTIQGYPAPFDQTVGEIKINLALGGRPGPLSPGAVGSRGASFEMDYIRILTL